MSAPRLLILIVLGVQACGHAPEPPAKQPAGAGKCEGGKLVRGACSNVVGELQLWNGWPPNVRIAVSDSVFGVGLEEDGVMPDSARAALRKADRVQASFRICPTGDQVTIPDWPKLVPIVCVEAFTPR